MKKCISVLIILLLLSSCLSFTVSAADASFTVSEDYKTMYLDGSTYSRADISVLSVDFTEIIGKNLALTETQKEEIKEVSFLTSETRSVILADFYFKDGSQLSVGFLRDDCREVYESLMSDADAGCVIDFGWPEGNQVATRLAQLRGETVTLNDTEFLEWCEYFSVTAQSSDRELSATKGSLLSYESQYYYVDFQENGISVSNYFFPGDYTHLKVHEITNEEVLESIMEAEEAYYSDSFGFFFDDAFTKGLSAVFLVFVFAVIPAVVLVMAVIFTIRTKGFYRRLWVGITALSAAELVIFAILTALITMPK